MDLPPPPMSSEAALRKYLTGYGWPTGLQNAFIAGTRSTPNRFMICDDSGSMMQNDGHRVVGEGPDARLSQCTRWSELTETLRFHIHAARLSAAPSQFRMLNGAAPISVGSSPSTDESGVPILYSILDGSPGGATPLCFQLNEVVKEITALAPQLRAAGKKASVIIYTDGEASDGDVTIALRPLIGLPVWVVIRLCTDDAAVVTYWNNVDDQLELNMDLIDDPVGEGRGVNKLNPWLTYGTPLHRLREFGVTVKEIDMIDEEILSIDQMRNVCAFIFGVKSSELPQPETEWKAFSAAIAALNEKEPFVWSPISKNPERWINIKKMNETYGSSSKSTPQSNSGGTDLGDFCCVIA